MTQFGGIGFSRRVFCAIALVADILLQFGFLLDQLISESPICHLTSKNMVFIVAKTVEIASFCSFMIPILSKLMASYLVAGYFDANYMDSISFPLTLSVISIISCTLSLAFGGMCQDVYGWVFIHNI